jgi:hypothetical protein
MSEIYKQCEGTLEIQDDLNAQEQFNNWMDLKNVDQTKSNIVPSNLIQRLLERNETLSCYNQFCFERDGFEKGGGYDKATFDKACV